MIAQWPDNRSRTDATNGVYLGNTAGGTTVIYVYGPVTSGCTYSPELEELKQSAQRAAQMLAAREATKRFIERRFGYAPGPGRPSPKHATCSRRRFHRRTKP